MDAADTFCDYNNDGHIESIQNFASELADMRDSQRLEIRQATDWIRAAVRSSRSAMKFLASEPDFLAYVGQVFAAEVDHDTPLSQEEPLDEAEHAKSIAALFIKIATFSDDLELAVDDKQRPDNDILDELRLHVDVFGDLLMLLKTKKRSHADGFRELCDLQSRHKRIKVVTSWFSTGEQLMDLLRAFRSAQFDTLFTNFLNTHLSITAMIKGDTDKDYLPAVLQYVMVIPPSAQQIVNRARAFQNCEKLNFKIKAGKVIGIVELAQVVTFNQKFLHDASHATVDDMMKLVADHWDTAFSRWLEGADCSSFKQTHEMLGKVVIAAKTGDFSTCEFVLEAATADTAEARAMKDYATLFFSHPAAYRQALTLQSMLKEPEGVFKDDKEKVDKLLCDMGVVAAAHQEDMPVRIGYSFWTTFLLQHPRQPTWPKDLKILKGYLSKVGFKPEKLEGYMKQMHAEAIRSLEASPEKSAAAASTNIETLPASSAAAAAPGCSEEASQDQSQTSAAVATQPRPKTQSLRKLSVKNGKSKLAAGEDIDYNEL